VIGSLIALLLAAVALIAVVGRVLAPLDRITATARSITAGDRGRRLRPDRPGTELGRTAAAFDDMLDAVEGAEHRSREAEERVRHFLSEAAHELRTPLTGVQAAAEVLIRSELPRLERERLAVSVVREARRASRLVDDMLTMARIDGGIDLQRRPMELRELVEGVLAQRRLDPSAPSFRLAPGPPVDLVADPDRVTQVLANVIDNASRATGPGGQVEVEVAVPEGADAVVTVTDDGPGIPPPDRERVFERLVRLDEARSRDSGGAGLGLSIARGIARSHGGDLVCTSPAGGRGAVFRLSLPLSQE
jgi:two-component system, OmpR family, sensor kinase